jgi:putative ABC transport system permease protein
VIRYLLTGARARWRREAALLVLTLVSVALGVGSVVCIQVVNASAVAAFSASLRALDSDVDLSVVPDGPALDERLWLLAARDPAVVKAQPVIQFDARVRGERALYLDVQALDLTQAEALPFAGSAPQLGAPFRIPGFVALTGPFAARLGKTVGDRIEISLGTTIATLEIGALLDLGDRAALAGDRLAVMDVAEAQRLFARSGEFDRVDLVLRDDSAAVVEAARRRIEAALPGGVRLVTPDDREARADGLLAAFKVNLTALSFVSVLVGLFLVYAAVRAELVRRREEFGLLRSLGATRSQVVMLPLLEVSLVALLGTAIGYASGLFAAQRNVDAVSTAISNLYLLEAIRGLEVPAHLPWLALLVGVGGACVAALPPILEIVRADPRHLLSPRGVERRIEVLAPRLAMLGGALLVVAFAAWGLLLRGDRAFGFVLGAVAILVVPLFSPLLFTRVLARAPGFGFGLAYAARALSRRVGTAATSGAALGVATSMLFGITLMVGSFRDTVMRWVDTTIRAGIYVATESYGRAGGDAAIDDAVVARLLAHPAVVGVDRLRKHFVQLDDRRVTVLGVDPHPPGGARGGDRFPLLAGETPAAMDALERGGSVLVSEPLSHKLSLGAGDSIELPTRRNGMRRFEIAGVYYDYASEHGALVLSLADFGAVFGAGLLNSLGLHLRDDAVPEAVADELRDLTAGTPLVFTPNATLRREAMKIFDQTFFVTRILEASALAVAALGILLGLLILTAERGAEIALYRALGASRGQIFALFLAKGLAIGIVGILLGAGGGALLAFVLMKVINLAWFGWTIEPTLPLASLLRQTATILLAVGIASIHPSLLASRSRGEELSRERE